MKSLLLILAVQLFVLLSPLCGTDETQRLQTVRSLYEQKKWQEILIAARGAQDQSSDFDYYLGMAYARLHRWSEARDAFTAGIHKSPKDARFVTERAGAEYKLGHYALAKRDLFQALRLDPYDSYISDFLGTIFLLEGNTEAALKYWNKGGKPRLASVETVPVPQTDRQLLDRAVTFAAPGVLGCESLLKTESLLDNLQVVQAVRVDLSPRSDEQEADEYRATLHISERNGWGSSAMDGLISLLRGVPYETAYPSYFNLGGEAVNFDSLVRWDAQKRRISSSLIFPLFRQPAHRVRLFFDQRNENWNLSRTFLGATAVITDLNLQRFAGGAELHLVEGLRWDLTVGGELASREFRNPSASLTPKDALFFTDGKTADAWLGFHGSVLRVPERRLFVDVSGEARSGRNYASGLGAFASFRGEIKLGWLPKSRGDDYEFTSKLRGGRFFGDATLDQLYQLGAERDNDLWMRGHAGTIEDRKGRAPLGRRFLLSNSDFYKTVYQGGFFHVQLGPYLDTGAVADPSALFGSQKWLVDTGIQARIRVLGRVTVVASYGRDLRDGKDLIYATALR